MMNWFALVLPLLAFTPAYLCFEFLAGVFPRLNASVGLHVFVVSCLTSWLCSVIIYKMTKRPYDAEVLQWLRRISDPSTVDAAERLARADTNT